MKGYLTEKYQNMGSAYTCRRFLEEAAKAGVDLKMIGICDMVQTRNPDGGNELLHDKKVLEPADFILHRYKTGVLKDRADELGRRSYNSLHALKRYSSKADELYDLSGQLSAKLFRTPSYLVGMTGMNYHEITAVTGVPFVAKGLYGSCGREVFLIRTEQEYLALCSAYRKLLPEMLFEEYIETSAGRDLRCFVLHGEVRACMERRASDGFHANVAQGGTVREFPADERIRELAAEISRVTALDYFGLDLLFGREDYLFCEINITPGLEGIERASGKNLAAEVIDYIVHTI